ncbi:MAG TPA: glycosyltransferase [Kiritimatiellia bacterium]|jgi:glycosyltransferase involved in cell wall biosynthesis|nr:glycosyltransferase [Kiritimatiellia bacterium]HOE36039.1 glycosyltransferase [Kiritimatiellia bacterium]HOR73285.1 glycosyltransferase [Kiritimatiellia bacterium]HOU59838.1 glycosyltransferase [Kiritimatiellia bacterium]HPV47715.1 glycosyltransferase [Kiritimatiellia bacterium]
MRAIHQIVAGFANGDAISNEARAMREIFRGWGYASHIYCETRRILPELRGDARDLATHRDDFRPTDIVLLHLSIGSDVNDIFPTLPGRKVILYHNITPAEYFRGVQEATAHLLARGRQQAAALAGTAEVVLADSQFNATEIAALGHANPQVLPLVLDFSLLRAKPDRRILRQYRDGLVNILFVGRCAPNKRLEDLLNAFYYFQRYVQPLSRLIHVGSHAGLEQYHALLLARARELQLKNVVFAGAVRQAELNAFYQVARVFLCLSDHEGFCIPLLEAMTHDVPVVAYAAGAVPETLAGAGVLLRDKAFDLIAETLGRVAEDEKLRRALLATQRERLARYERQDLAAELKRLLQPLL